jgi:acid phosphatase
MAMAISFLTCCLAAALTIKIATAAVDNSWHPPETSAISDLDLNLDSDGVFGFIFNSSDTPDEHYGQYNYCNMPHVRRREYEKAPEGYELVYVEVVCKPSLYRFRNEHISWLT